MPKPATVIDFQEALTFRLPMRVSAVRAFRFSSGMTTFPICPRCQITMEREYQSYCDRCGQALDWHGFAQAVIVLPDK